MERLKAPLANKYITEKNEKSSSSSRRRAHHLRCRLASHDPWRTGKPEQMREAGEKRGWQHVGDTEGAEERRGGRGNGGGEEKETGVRVSGGAAVAGKGGERGAVETEMNLGWRQRGRVNPIF